MAATLRLRALAAALSLALGLAVDGTTSCASSDSLDENDLSVSMLQVSFASRKDVARKHHWSHARGNVGAYSSTGVSMPANLSSAFAWSWTPEANLSSFLWATLIDSDRNIYACGAQGVFKFTPDGQQLWHNPTGTLSPSLMGDGLYGMTYSAMVFKVDLATGATVWEKQASPDRGQNGDFVEAHDGVVVVTGEIDPALAGTGGAPSLKVIGIDAANGDRLWEFAPECGIWNLLALFPQDDTTVFMDFCGGLYRLGLHNGTLFWKAPQVLSFTDGGPIMGPDGSTYTCTDPQGQLGLPGGTGLMRKFRLSDGAKLWEVKTPYPCVNFPAVSADGRTVVVASGALAEAAKTKEALGMPEASVREFFELQQSLGQSQRSHYGMPDIPAALMAFNASDGAVLWRHEVQPWGRIAFAGDEERALDWAMGRGEVSSCWPAHWSGPVIGADGTVYVGRSTGDFYAFSPERGETTFHTGDGALMAGPAFAPGLMAFTTCSHLFVFKTQQA
mmetsp:Transcript_69922/g.198172  ORF Transcript_69922/g.198172 Transcript_69922/m.198172 type:complete len:503 (-) Transcript_69922:58-1566(-)